MRIPALVAASILSLTASCSSKSADPPAAPTFAAKIRGAAFTPVSKLVFQSGYGPVKYAMLLDHPETCEQLLADKTFTITTTGRWAQVPVFWEQTVSKIDENTSFNAESSPRVTGDHGTVTLEKSVGAGETAHLVFDAHGPTDQDSLVGPLDAIVCD